MTNPCPLCSSPLRHIPTLQYGLIWKCSRCNYFAGQTADFQYIAGISEAGALWPAWHWAEPSRN